MVVRKITISITDELEGAIGIAAVSQNMSKSRTIETLLREHPTIAKYVEIVRAEEKYGMYVAGASYRKSIAAMRGASASGTAAPAKPGRRRAARKPRTPKPRTPSS